MARSTPWLIAALLMAGLALPGAAQLPPAAELLPPGFKVELDQNVGGTRMMRGSRLNENVPRPHSSRDVTIDISSMTMPGADQMLAMIAAQPEDPARQVPGSVSREEPCGVQPYQDGVLRCRKTITPWVGSGSGPDLITWSLSWSGKGPSGLVNVGVSNFVGDQATARRWIDGLIPRLKAGN